MTLSCIRNWRQKRLLRELRDAAYTLRQLASSCPNPTQEEIETLEKAVVCCDGILRVTSVMLIADAATRDMYYPELMKLRDEFEKLRTLTPRKGKVS